MSRRALSAFTLVELLVVIGIIGVLISILIPTLSSARDRANEVKCLANVRNFGNAWAGYAAEHKGQLPWGWVWDSWNPKAYAPNGGNARFSNWVSTLGYYMNRNRTEGSSAGMLTSGGARWGEITEAFRCPSVTSDFQQPNTYTGLLTAFPDWYWENNGYTPNGGGPGVAAPDVIRPARLNDFYPDNIMIWETNANGNILATDSDMGGVGPAYSFIDGGQLLYPQDPTTRYRVPGFDPYSGDYTLEQGAPILISTPKYYYNSNRDCPQGTNMQLGQAGTPRFRHRKERGCVMIFADGSARTMTWNPGLRIKQSPNYAQTDILRKMIMIKFPTGKAAG